MVIGSINLDLVTSTTQLPKVGETVLGYSFQTIPSGNGANQAGTRSVLGCGWNHDWKSGKRFLSRVLFTRCIKYIFIR
jgi:hypothetical protein